MYFISFTPTQKNVKASPTVLQGPWRDGDADLLFLSSHNYVIYYYVPVYILHSSFC